ncbi:hypothetical protein PF011_g24129 [Phytophthora fragariae]|uniref:Secreted protein n=1 Tax=Phytophthora fragariae TaxID=53985 RepID=A0A6A3I4B0_9STRA|nr:hypothetical protein PF011_g24129 [Phytophthora fragariae]
MRMPRKSAISLSLTSNLFTYACAPGTALFDEDCCASSMTGCSSSTSSSSISVSSCTS